MRVVAIHGSPRASGNSALLLEAAARGVADADPTAEVVVYRPAALTISPCLACGACASTGRCRIEDDMARVSQDVRLAPRIIVSSPVYFMGLPAQLKALVDRGQALWAERHRLGRVIPSGPDGRRGLVLLVGGAPQGRGYRCTAASVRSFLRTVGVDREEVLVYPEVDEIGAIRSHPSALVEAMEAGRRLGSAQEIASK